MSRRQIDFRLADEADLDACADVLYAADDDLSLRRGVPTPPRNRQALVALFAHMWRRDPDRFWVATDARRVVGFGAASAYGDMVYLGFLFVLPEHQAGGTGRVLLEHAMHDSDYRAVAIASYQPISAALYAKYGMVPRVPIYLLSGLPRFELPPLPAGVTLTAIAENEVDALDREVCGLSRPEDHDWWQSLGRLRFGLEQAGVILGYGYAQAVGRIGPVVVRDREHLLPFIGALMKQVPPPDAWLINVPGPAAEAFVGLLHAGMRLDGPPGIFCATEVRIDHTRYSPASYALP